MFPDGARFGGAPGNFAHHAASLGASTSMVSAVGCDDLGRRAIERLKGSQIDVSQVVSSQTHPTGSVDITVDNQGNPSYQFHQNEAWDFLCWSDELASLASRCDAVCFGTLGQRSDPSRETIQRFVSATKETALRIFDINLRPPFFSDSAIDQSLSLANVLKLNDEELKYLAEHFDFAAGSEIEWAKEIRHRYGLKLVAMTRGPRGALVVGQDSVIEVDAKPTEVSDTVGAGDAFTAALTRGLLSGGEIEKVAQSACRVAEYVCSQPGATPSLPETLR